MIENTQRNTEIARRVLLNREKVVNVITDYKVSHSRAITIVHNYCRKANLITYEELELDSDLRPPYINTLRGCAELFFNA